MDELIDVQYCTLRLFLFFSSQMVSPWESGRPPAPGGGGVGNQGGYFNGSGGGGMPRGGGQQSDMGEPYGMVSSSYSSGFVEAVVVVK